MTSGLISLGSVPLSVPSKHCIMSVRSPSQSPSKHITVVDVYDLAASIGKDFERIIDQFGNDSVRQLMPKELEAVEENYRKEIDDLWTMVKTPRDEDLNVMIELRELSNKQKEQIKELQRDIETYSCEVENLHNSIEKLIRQNEELLRKNASLQKQGRMLGKVLELEEELEQFRPARRPGSAASDVNQELEQK
uniref:RH1 domain-containing protein n=1 Tax=Parascaris equorum TaxID=6256 RepID=A0A914RCX5_PAREQ